MKDKLFRMRNYLHSHSQDPIISWIHGIFEKKKKTHEFQGSRRFQNVLIQCNSCKDRTGTQIYNYTFLCRRPYYQLDEKGIYLKDMNFRAPESFKIC